MQHLQQAFDQFNRLSAQLNASVDQINENVDRIRPPAQPRAEVEPQLLDAIPGGVVVLDRHGQVAEANQAARELLGSSLEQQAWRDIVARVFLP
ncbi:MAG: PAS domain-containing protein, partial [Gammaproteobacteria bacterium]|nr:PAS domain-containing protein [Gammaproteobacteria bacterium]